MNVFKNKIIYVHIYKISKRKIMEGESKKRNEFDDNTLEFAISSPLIKNHVLKYLYTTNTFNIKDLIKLRYVSFASMNTIYRYMRDVLNFFVTYKNIDVLSAKKFMLQYYCPGDKTEYHTDTHVENSILDIATFIESDKCICLKDVKTLKDLAKIDSITKLSLVELNEPVTKDMFPIFLTHLSLTYAEAFDQPLDDLPTLCLTHLYLGCNFNQPIDNLPVSLTYLSINGVFNQPINLLPKNLEVLHLTGAYCFDQPIDHLPSSLTELTLGDSFNQTIDILPVSLRVLELGGAFNKFIDNLPSTLIYLVIGNFFNRSLDKLPPSLKKLCLFCFTDGRLKSLPSSLRKITLNYCHVDLETLVLPSSVIQLTLTYVLPNTSITSLPSSIKILKIHGGPIDVIPNTLNIVKLDKNSILSEIKESDLITKGCIERCKKNNIKITYIKDRISKISHL